MLIQEINNEIIIGGLKLVNIGGAQSDIILNLNSLESVSVIDSSAEEVPLQITPESCRL